MGENRAYKNKKRNKKSKARKQDWQKRGKLTANNNEKVVQGNIIDHDHSYYTSGSSQSKNVALPIKIIDKNCISSTPSVTSKPVPAMTNLIGNMEIEDDGDVFLTPISKTCTTPAKPGITTVQTSPILNEFSFITEEEYNRVMEHEIVTEVQPPIEPLLKGHRIVDLNYVLSWAMKLQHNHSKICTTGTLEVVKEDRRGLMSYITFKCNFCGYEVEQCTHNTKNDKEENGKINVAAVWGTISTGSTYNNLKERLAVMDIPPMAYSLFRKLENSLGAAWEKNLWLSIEKAGHEEYQLAVQNGQVDKDGNAWIVVYTDCGWSHRSYGHSYNASSGVAVIIRKATGKILFLGVRNKYCSICSRAENKNEKAHEHRCFKNWEASSGAMEADIIVEGFLESLKTHKLKYLKYIGDGDSSASAKIRDLVPYGNEVTKTQCTNHAVKNYGKSLYKIKQDTSVSITGRKLLTVKSIKNLQEIAMKVLYVNAQGLVEDLKADLLNGPYHIFNDHSNCKSSYCDNVGDKENSKIQQLKDSGIFYHISGALDRLVAKGHQLIDNETNNRAELFMSILCKFNAGKRLNLTQRGSFSTRANLSGLRYNNGVDWQNSSWKSVTKSSPGEHFKKFLEEKIRNEDNRKIRETENRENKITGTKRKLTFDDESNAKKISKKCTSQDHYGPNALQPPMSEEEYNSEKKRILKSLEVSSNEIDQIEQGTKGQWDNPQYLIVRQNRLTASRFGEVCRKRRSNPGDALAARILYPKNIYSEAVQYGKLKEKVALQKFASQKKVEVHQSGLFIDIDNPYLAASPDGLLGTNSLLEVKCLYKANKTNISLAAAAERYKKANFCLGLNEEGQLKLKRTHNYYYQIQGQLNICKKELCFFVVYINDEQPLYIEVIQRDKEFWKNEMLPKLQAFYFDQMLPEIVTRKAQNIKKNKNKFLR